MPPPRCSARSGCDQLLLRLPTRSQNASNCLNGSPLLSLGIPTSHGDHRLLPPARRLSGCSWQLPTPLLFGPRHRAGTSDNVVPNYAGAFCWPQPPLASVRAFGAVGAQPLPRPLLLWRLVAVTPSNTLPVNLTSLPQPRKVFPLSATCADVRPGVPRLGGCGNCPDACSSTTILARVLRPPWTCQASMLESWNTGTLNRPWCPGSH